MVKKDGKKDDKMKTKHRKLIKSFLFIITLLFIILMGVAAYYKGCLDPYRGTVKEFQNSLSADNRLSAVEAKEDLLFLMEHLEERHPAWLDGSEELTKAVEMQYEKEIAAINTEITVKELNNAAARIAAKLHDGHTYVTWYHDTQMRYVDDFTQFWTYGDPISIDGISIQNMWETYQEMASYEREEYAREQFLNNIIVSEYGLQSCGIDTSDGVVMLFDNQGELVEQRYDFVPLEEVNGYTKSESGLKEETGWVFYQIDEENSLGIFTITECIYNKEYKETLASFFEQVEEKNIQNIAVDLRGNGGGNSRVANEFIRYLNVDKYRSWDFAIRFGQHLWQKKDIEYKNRKKEPGFEGNLYVLTDIWTYSSAMDFAMLIGDNDLGAIVGQASGNMPDSYGDCLYFQMPHSKLAVSISYKRWYRLDRSRSGEPLIPDYETDSENALDKVYDLIQM